MMDFVSFALKNVETLSRAQTNSWRTYQSGRKTKQVTCGRLTTNSVRSEGTIVQMCSDNKVAERWINGYFVVEKIHGQNRKYMEDTTFDAEKKRMAVPIRKIGGYVKHIWKVQSRG